MLNLHRINVLTKLLGIIGLTFDVRDQLLSRFLHSSGTGEKMKVQSDSTTAIHGLQEIMYNILTEFWAPMKPTRLIKIYLNKTCTGRS